jgi:hypothetical protein
VTSESAFLGLEHLSQALADFLMAEKFPAVELVKTGLHLLPKPYIVIKIVLDELLHVLVRASRDFRCNTVKLRLQFRGKVYFHVPRVGKTGAGVKQGSKGLFAFKDALNGSLAV